jgi:hypothetical protein
MPEITSGCRIGRVKLKGGAELHRLPTPERDKAQRAIMRAAAMVVGFYKPDEIIGHVVMAWAKDGSYSIGYRVGDDGPVGFGLLPSFVADALRRRMIEEGEWET